MDLRIAHPQALGTRRLWWRGNAVPLQPGSQWGMGQWATVQKQKLVRLRPPACSSHRSVRPDLSRSAAKDAAKPNARFWPWSRWAASPSATSALRRPGRLSRCVRRVTRCYGPNIPSFRCSALGANPCRWDCGREPVFLHSCVLAERSLLAADTSTSVHFRSAAHLSHSAAPERGFLLARSEARDRSAGAFYGVPMLLGDRRSYRAVGLCVALIIAGTRPELSPHDAVSLLYILGGSQKPSWFFRA